VTAAMTMSTSASPSASMTCQPFCLSRSKTTAVAKTINITDATRPTFVGNKDDFLSNERNKKVDMITERLRQKDCHVIEAEGDADVDIVKAAVTMSLSLSAVTLVQPHLSEKILIFLYCFYTTIT